MKNSERILVLIQLTTKILEVDNAKINNVAEYRKLLHTKTEFVGGAKTLNTTAPNHNQGYSPWRWAIGTGALTHFNECEISYNGQVLDDTTSWPQRGQFYNQEAAIAFYTCGDDEFIEREKQFGHFIPFSD